MNIKTPLQTLNMLIELSPAVEEMYDTKAYLIDVDSEDIITDEYILVMAYKCILKELDDMGLSYYCETDDFFEDMYSAEAIYYLRKIVDPINMYEYFTINNRMIPVLQDTFHSSITATSDIISIIFDMMYELDTNNYDLDRASEIEDKFTSSINFKLYVENIMDMATLKPTEIDVEKYNEMIKIVDRDRSNFKHIIAIFSSKDSSLNSSILSSKIKYYDLNKINNDDSNIYAWCLTLDKEELINLTPQLKNLYDHFMNIHRSTSTHHVEYWLLNKPEYFNKETLCELVGHFYDPDKTSEDIKKEYFDMLQKGDELFNESNKKYMITLMNLLLTEHSINTK